jgi:hypothetical protein
MGGRRGAYRILVGRPEGKNHLEDPGVDGRIILKLIFKKWDWGGGAWTGLISLRIGTGHRKLWTQFADVITFIREIWRWELL